MVEIDDCNKSDVTLASTSVTDSVHTDSFSSAGAAVSAIDVSRLDCAALLSIPDTESVSSAAIFESADSSSIAAPALADVTRVEKLFDMLSEATDTFNCAENACSILDVDSEDICCTPRSDI